MGYAKSRTRAYERLEGNIWKIFDGGRDREGAEPVEYCDNRFLEACDSGLESVERRLGGEVISGGNGGRLAFAEGDAAGGEAAGEELCDMASKEGR